MNHPIACFRPNHMRHHHPGSRPPRAGLLLLAVLVLFSGGRILPCSASAVEASGESTTPAEGLSVQRPHPIGPPEHRPITEPEPGRSLEYPLKLPTTTSPKAPSLETTIEGINFDQDASNNGSYHIPPDPFGAAGLDHLATVVNTSIEWFTKSGTLDNSEALSSFFSSLSPLTDTFDPKVIYDQHAERFVVLTLEKTDTADGDASDTSRIFLAVSDDSDPNGSWHFKAIDSLVTVGGTDHWADYPGLAADEEALYITSNIFSFGDRVWGGIRLWIVDKGLGSGGFYDGGALSYTLHDFYDEAGIPELASTTMPAQIYGTPPAGVGTWLLSYSGLSSGDDEFLAVIRVDDPLGTPDFSEQTVAMGDIDDLSVDPLPDAPQQDTGTTVEVNDRRLLHAVWRDHSLWATTTIAPSSGDDAGQTTAHWLEVDTSTLSDLSLLQQGNVGGEDVATGAYTFFPSLAVDKFGNMVIGFALSAPTLYPGAYYTGRQAGDPAGTLQPVETLAAGVDYYVRTFGGSRNRWGDYSSVWLDPSDELTFWLYNEYAMTRGTDLGDGELGRWATRLGSVILNSSDQASIAFDSDTYNAGDTITVTVVDQNAAEQDLTVSVKSNAGDSEVITVSDPDDDDTYIGQIELGAPLEPITLADATLQTLVGSGTDWITTKYINADDGQGNTDVELSDQADVSGTLLLTVWVEFGDPGSDSDGSSDRPFHTLREATWWVTDSGTIKIKPGGSSETISITRPMRLEAPDGGVTIGAP